MKRIINGVQQQGKKYKNLGSRIIVERLGRMKNEILEALLSEYAPEITAVINSYNKKSQEETMMIKRPRQFNQETTNRKIHQDNVANIADRIAKGINKRNKGIFKLNRDVIEIMARNHDIGHTFLGHSGEWWLSNIKEDYGIGYYCHNALGPRELIYTNNIYDRIIETIKQSHPEIGTKKLARIKNSLWIIMDGINSHNGEKSESEFVPDLSKTKEDFEKELMGCFVKKGFDRTIVPATPEAALMRMCDKISYIPYDMVDGLREGMITELNEEYRVILRQLGITDKETDEYLYSKDYESLARRLQTIFINDVIEHSTASAIILSSGISRLMHELRNINNRQIVNNVVLREDLEIYPKALRHLMEQYSDILQREGIIEKLKNGDISKEEKDKIINKYSGTPYELFIIYTCNTRQEDFNFTLQMISEASRQGIKDEQERARQIVESGEEFNVSEDFSNRDKRISYYIAYFRNKDLSEYSDEYINKDIDIVFKNICDSTKRNPLFIEMDQRIALELGAKYLATLNDIEFLNLLLETDSINNEQYVRLTRKYKDINVRKEAQIQSNWRVIAEEQEAETRMKPDDAR